MKVLPASMRSGWIRAGIRTAVLLSFLLASLSPSMAAGPGHKMRVSVDDLVSYFDTVVFGSEHGAEYAAHVVARWQGPVGIRFQGHVTPQYRKFVRTHLQTLSNLTNLEFNEVEPGDSAPGIYIRFAPRAEMTQIPVPPSHRAAVERAAQNANCFFFSWKKPPSRIIKTIIVADIGKDPAILNSCLLEELTQALGLPNDSDMLRPSIFSDRDRLYELGPQDRVLVHTLYDPRMQPGMSKGEALRTAREIISELARPAAEPSTSRAPGG